MLSSHFHPDPSEALRCLVASVLMEVLPAARGERREEQKEDEKERSREEEGEESLSSWTRSSVVLIRQLRCSRQDAEEGCEP